MKITLPSLFYPEEAEWGDSATDLIFKFIDQHMTDAEWNGLISRWRQTRAVLRDESRRIKDDSSVFYPIPGMVCDYYHCKTWNDYLYRLGEALRYTYDEEWQRQCGYEYEGDYYEDEEMDLFGLLIQRWVDVKKSMLNIAPLPKGPTQPLKLSSLWWDDFPDYCLEFLSFASR